MLESFEMADHVTREEEVLTLEWLGIFSHMRCLISLKTKQKKFKAFSLLDMEQHAHF
jgi:hypothetical protein